MRNDPTCNSSTCGNMWGFSALANTQRYRKEGAMWKSCSCSPDFSLSLSLSLTTSPRRRDTPLFFNKPVRNKLNEATQATHTVEAVKAMMF